MTPTLFVFFGNGDGSRVPRSIRAITEFAPHVSVGDGDVVYDSGRFFPLIPYTMRCPGLERCVAVTTPLPPVLEGLPKPTGRWWLDVLLRRDCVPIAVAALRRAGVRVPLFIVTPAQLYDFVRELGGQEYAM